MWVPTQAEVLQLRRQAEIEAWDRFLYPREREDASPKRELKPLTEQQEGVYNLVTVGWKPKQIAKRMDLPLASVYDAIAKIKHWGYMT
jgi:DNA-binding NarL/FixJ family response regulator